MTRLPVSTWAWIGANAVLAILLGAWWWLTPGPIERLAQVKPILAALPFLPTPGAPDVIAYASMRDQAVFYASRSYITPPDPTQLARVRPTYQFVAAMVKSGNGSVAFLKRPTDNTTVKIHLDDDVDGWRVSTIEARRVVVELNGESFEIAAASGKVPTGITRVSLSPGNRVAATSGVRVLGSQESTRPNIATTVPSETSARLYRPPQ